MKLLQDARAARAADAADAIPAAADDDDEEEAAAAPGRVEAVVTPSVPAAAAVEEDASVPAADDEDEAAAAPGRVEAVVTSAVAAAAASDHDEASDSDSGGDAPVATVTRGGRKRAAAAPTAEPVKRQKAGVSKYVGVRKLHAKWAVTIRINGEQKYLGSFDDELAAARAYAEARAKAPVAAPTSKYLGVYFTQGRYVARIGIDGKDKFLGSFAGEDEAARVYDEARVKQGKSRVNFP